MTGMAGLSLREAWRGLTRQRSTFVVAVLTLALGLGLTIAMGCVLHGVLLRPVGGGDGRRVVMAWAGYQGGNSDRDLFDEQSLTTWRQASQVFEHVGGFNYTTVTLLQRGEPVSLQGAIVSPEIFSVLQARAQVGTPFSPEQAHREQGKVALLSYALWRQRFGADPAAVGAAVNLGDENYTVVGVMPDDFDVPSHETAVWVPLPPGGARTRSLMVIARLRDGVGLEQARADAERVARQLAADFPETHAGMRIHIVPFADELVRESRPLVLMGAAAALLVLLICCANVSNLLLVRAIARRPEFATRSAIGARRAHLLGLVFSEALLLALCAGVLGAGAAKLMIGALLRLSPVELPRAATVGQGLQLPLAALPLALLAALLVALPSAWDVLRARLSLTGDGTRSTSRPFVRQAIVALELAVALTLLAGSALMVRTTLALRGADPGWRTQNLLAATVLLPQVKYRDPGSALQFFESFLERLRASPGVVAAAASSAVPANPVGADMDLPIQIPGRSADETGRAGVRVVTSGFFAAAGIPLLQGRDFDDSDRDRQVRRALVNRAFARKYMPDAPSAVGGQFSILAGPAPVTYEIVGVVGDVYHYGMLRDPKPEFYLPFAARPRIAMGVVVRTAGDPLAFAPEFRRQLWALDAELPVVTLDSMERMVDATWKDRSLLARVMVFFSVVVLVLTLVGVFAVAAYAVSRQVREIGIRMALGAQRDDVLRLVMGQSAWAVGAGVALGLLGAVVLGRALASQLYRVSPGDPLAFAAGAVGLALVAALGTYLPSRRATRVDPATVLRVE